MTDEPVQLLVVDDDDQFRRMMARWFLDAGFRVTEADSGEAACKVAESTMFDVAVVDLRMPGIDGVDVLKRLKSGGDCTEVILLTGQATVPSAVDSMKSGAFDYLMKPVPLRELEAVVRRADKKTRRLRSQAILKGKLPFARHGEMIGDSPAMQEVFRLISRGGPSEAEILIRGEPGVGKRLAARTLHQLSRRCEQPLLTADCRAIPDSLVESELFGHEADAFPGAGPERPGLVERAKGGALYLEEIGELPLAAQARLVQVIQESTNRRVGATREQPADVRIIASSTRDLSDDVRQGRFREDLFYRINVMSIQIPPLRERGGDISLLTAHMLGENWSIEPEALAALQDFDWPGNVRQLGNAIERARIVADNQVVRLEDLPEEIRPSTPASNGSGQSDDLASLERAKVVEVLRRMSGNKTHAARQLGIDRRKLYRLVEKHQIRKEEFSGANK